MSNVEVTFYPSALTEVINTHIGHMLDQQAQRVTEVIQTNLSVQHVYGERNPPGNFPRRRTGLLKQQTHHEPGELIDGFISRTIFSNAIHNEFFYPKWLKDEGYVFIREEQLIALKQ